MPRYFIHMAFKGTQYCGWQWQPNDPSVQATLNEAMEKILQVPVMVVGCGRTDTGVHARDYYAHVDLDIPLPERFVFKLNNVLPSDIVIFSMWEVEPDKHARYSAAERTYEYHIHTQKDPFIRSFSTEYRFSEFDWEKINRCTELLKSYTDFKPLSKFNPDNKTTLCTIYEARWNQTGPHSYCFTISANRFLHNMVRRTVATLLAIGQGKISEEEFKQVMESTGEFRMILKAPSIGLALTKVHYPFLDKEI